MVTGGIITKKENGGNMVLKEFLENFGNNCCVTIERYCNEKEYDYIAIPLDEDALSDDNPNHYKPSCLAKEAWWGEVESREIKKWGAINAGSYGKCKPELYIELEDADEENETINILCYPTSKEEQIELSYLLNEFAIAYQNNFLNILTGELDKDVEVFKNKFKELYDMINMLESKK